MALKNNPFTPHLKTLLDCLTELEYCSFVQKFVTQDKVSALEEALVDWKASSKEPKRVLFGASARLPIPVLTAPPNKDYLHPGKSAIDQHHINVVSELNSRLQAQLLSIAFESLEGFLKGFAGVLYFHTRTEDGTQKVRLVANREKFHEWRRTKEGKQPAPQTLDYFHQYVEWYTTQNCKALIKDLKKALPEFASTASTNWSGTDLFDFIRVLTTLRQRIVHHGGVMDDKSFVLIPHAWRDLIKDKVLRDSVITGQWTILPQEGFVTFSLKRTGALAMLLYHVASEALGMKNDFPQAHAV